MHGQQERNCNPKVMCMNSYATVFGEGEKTGDTATKNKSVSTTKLNRKKVAHCLYNCKSKEHMKLNCNCMDT